MLLSQHNGYTKYPGFLCLWDSRAKTKHGNRNNERKEFTPGEKNILNQALVDPKKVLLPPLHIKLSLMKQYVKSQNKHGTCFGYICQKFPALSNEKLIAGIFDGPKIRQLMKDKKFIETMNLDKKEGWMAFRQVVSNFLGNTKLPNYKELVKNLLCAFQKLGCNIHFLHSHLDYFPENLGAMSEEQGECFHQDIKTMEKRYQGRWNVNMMADYCWCLMRDEKTYEHS